MCTSKTLGLEVMEIKVIFLIINNTQFRRSKGAISSQSKEGANGLCVKCNKGKTLCDRRETTIKRYVISELMKKYG